MNPDFKLTCNSSKQNKLDDNSDNKEKNLKYQEEEKNSEKAEKNYLHEDRFNNIKQRRIGNIKNYSKTSFVNFENENNSQKFSINSNTTQINSNNSYTNTNNNINTKSSGNFTNHHFYQNCGCNNFSSNNTNFSRFCFCEQFKNLNKTSDNLYFNGSINDKFNNSSSCFNLNLNHTKKSYCKMNNKSNNIINNTYSNYPNSDRLNETYILKEDYNKNFLNFRENANISRKYIDTKDLGIRDFFSKKSSENKSFEDTLSIKNNRIEDENKNKINLYNSKFF